MFQDIAYALIFGKPLIMYLGIITILLFFLTAVIALLNRRGIRTIPFKWHPRMAFTSISLGLIRGFLAVMHYV